MYLVKSSMLLLEYSMYLVLKCHAFDQKIYLPGQKSQMPTKKRIAEHTLKPGLRVTEKIKYAVFKAGPVSVPTLGLTKNCRGTTGLIFLTQRIL